MASPHHGTLKPALVLLTALLLGVSSHEARTDARSNILSACEDTADFSAARSPDDPDFDFSAWEATIFDGARVKGSSLRWHLRPSSTSQTSARLALSRPATLAAETVAVWVKNPNAHDLTLRAEIIDADGARYLSPPVNLLEETGWREVVFDLRTMTGPDDDPAPGIDAPVAGLAFVLEGLTADRPHTIYLDEITARSTEAAALAVRNVRCQTSLGPGEPLPLRAEVSPGDAVVGAQISAELAADAGGAVAWAPVEIAERSGDSALVTARLRVPEWVAPGRYEVRLVSGLSEITHAETVGVVVAGQAQASARSSIDTDVRPPTVVIDGEKHLPLVEELRGSLPGELSEDAKIVALPATTDVHPFRWAPPTMRDDAGKLQFTGLERRAAAVLDERPRAALVLQVFLDASPEWKDAHNDHLQHFDGGALAPPTILAAARRHPDLLSPTWQSAAQEHLRALIQHVKQSPWGHRVIGYELQAGDLGAWRPWGASLAIGDDTTVVRKQEFLAWLHERYPSASDLRDGWLGRRRGFGRPRAAFESVEIPLPLEGAPEPSLYDPAADQPMIDLRHFKAESMADALLGMAAVVREEAGGEVLVGACYGHLLAQARSNDWAWPHTALTRVLESGALDFLTGPQMRLDDAGQPSSLGESIRRGGAVYLERLHAGAAPDDCGALVPAGAVPQAQFVTEPAAPSADSTVIEVVDDRSARYLSGDAQLPRELLTRPISGSIPHETYLVRDLLATRPPRGSIFIFRNLFTIEPDNGRLLGRNTARDDSLLIWVYAPGAVDRHLITGRTMQYLTGLKLVPLMGRQTATVRPESGMLSPFGYPHAIDPMFICADENAEWLGTIAGSSEQCAFALREFPHCTSVFSLAPPTEEVIRHLARRAGIDPGSHDRQ
ncbi:MAG: hypothetical protein R6V07_02395 [Armatimonadota bacterium]